MPVALDSGVRFGFSNSANNFHHHPERGPQQRSGIGQRNNILTILSGGNKTLSQIVDSRDSVLFSEGTSVSLVVTDLQKHGLIKPFTKITFKGFRPTVISGFKITESGRNYLKTSR